jgi:uncharacterized protein
METKRVLKIGALVVVSLMLISSLAGYLYVRSMLYKEPIYDNIPPELPAEFGRDNRPAILVFSKTNGFRHEFAIPAGQKMLEKLAASRGWAVFSTENAAVFTPEALGRVDVVVSNNGSGDNTTEDQEAALRSFVEDGGGFVGIHGAGGDYTFEWQFYVDYLIGAQFIGHIMNPQFQEATVIVEDATHPATRHLKESWNHTEEWYSFESSPRSRGVNVLLSVDEDSYEQTGMMPWTGLSMGDHPVTWNHCVGAGRVFYTALGHEAPTYELPEFIGLVGGAIAWVAGHEGEGCEAAISSP